MPKYVKTVSFRDARFKPSKVDPQVNSTLDGLRAAGATIDEIRSLMTSSWVSSLLEYVIIYEAPSEIRQ